MSNWFQRILTAGVIVIAASAAQAQVDVSNDTITCNTVTGTALVKPALSNAGSASTPTLTVVKGTLNGCSVSGPHAAVIDSGKFTGKLTGVGNTCTGLVGTTPRSGTIVIKWKTPASFTGILQTSSTVTVTGVTGSLHSESLNGGPQSYGDFVINSSGVTGAFTGGDGGSTSGNEIVASDDVGATLLGCASTAGVKTLHIGLGTITLK